MADAGMPRGVSWNNVAKKYTARMMVGGVRKSLGYFDTVAAAEKAYNEARLTTPPQPGGRPSSMPSNAETIRKALASHLEPGRVLVMPDNGQEYELVNIEHKTSEKGNPFKVYHWRSECRVCGEGFDTASMAFSDGFVRTCEEHRDKVRSKARSEGIQRAREAEGSPAVNPSPAVGKIGGVSPRERAWGIIARDNKLPFWINRNGKRDIFAWNAVLGLKVWGQIQKEEATLGIHYTRCPTFKRLEDEAMRLGCTMWEIVDAEDFV